MEYRKLSDDELIEAFAGRDYYDSDLCAEICDRAGLEEEWAEADSETFDSVLCRAIEILAEDI